MKQWFTFNRQPIPDIEKLVLDLIQEDTILMIGTDAQRIGRRTDFVTVLIMYKPGKGARVFSTKETVKRDMSPWEKLSKETWLSVEVAMQMDALLHIPDRIEVHVDSNSDERFDSSDYVKQLGGMGIGQGFRYTLKPEAAASSHAADHIVKNKHLPSPARKAVFKRKSRRQK